MSGYFKFIIVVCRSHFFLVGALLSRVVLHTVLGSAADDATRECSPLDRPGWQERACATIRNKSILWAKVLICLRRTSLANVPRWIGQGGRNARVLRKQERDILRGIRAGRSGHLTVVCQRLLLFSGAVSVAGSDPEHVRTGIASIIAAAYY